MSAAESPGSAPPAEGERLAKRVAALRGCSRSQAEALIEAGSVTVAGVVVDEPARRVTPQQQVVVDPNASVLQRAAITVLVHHTAELGDTVPSPADPRAPRLSTRQWAQMALPCPLPAGATGLAVRSNDARVLRKFREEGEWIEHEVLAEVQGTVSPEQLARLGHGLALNGRALAPLKVSINSTGVDRTRLRLALKGVAPHEVAAMCDAVGLTLLGLKRLRIGRVALAGLAPGQWRVLHAGERF